MKSKFFTIFSAFFFVICALPCLLIPFVSADSSAENRELSELPQPITEGKFNRAFFGEFSDYLSERFVFRNELISLSGIMQEKIFSSSAQKKVITGKDDWLFFNETLDDYTGKNPLDKRTINNIASTLKMLETYLDKENTDFIFFVAPNKNTLYPEFMPSRYLKTKAPSNLENLTASLIRKCVTYLDIQELFANEDEILYHKRDSHWNNKGALLATNALLKMLGKQESAYTCASAKTDLTWRGDLDKMLYPSLEKFDEQTVFDYTPTYEYASNFQTADDINIRTESEAAEGSLLMFRDSFGIAMLPFIAEEFAQMYYTRTIPFSMNLLKLTPADAVIIEIVERNIINLQKYAPVMPAPEAAPPPATEIPGNDTVNTRKTAGLIHIFGTVDEEFLGDENRIYVTISTQNGAKTYEAFPVYETDLPESEATGSNGFSLYIDAREIPESGAEIIITTDSGSNRRKSPPLPLPVAE